jgi:hypothetical protein
MAGKGKPFVNGDPRAGRPPGVVNERTRTVRELCRELVADSAYQAALRQRLIDGKAGNMEQLVWHYAFGEPPAYQVDSLTEMLETLPPLFPQES